MDSPSHTVTLFDPPLAIQRYVKIAQIIEQHPDVKTVVDIGCGSCALFALLKETQIRNYIGVEVNEAIIESCHATNSVRPSFVDVVEKRSSPLKVELFCGDLTRFDEEFRDLLASAEGQVCFVLCEV